MCFMRFSESAAILFLNSINRFVFVRQRQCVSVRPELKFLLLKVLFRRTSSIKGLSNIRLWASEAFRPYIYFFLLVHQQFRPAYFFPETFRQSSSEPITTGSFHLVSWPASTAGFCKSLFSYLLGRGPKHYRISQVYKHRQPHLQEQTVTAPTDIASQTTHAVLLDWQKGLRVCVGANAGLLSIFC
jgi:hypothetical protein